MKKLAILSLILLTACVTDAVPETPETPYTSETTTSVWAYDTYVPYEFTAPTEETAPPEAQDARLNRFAPAYYETPFAFDERQIANALKNTDHAEYGKVGLADINGDKIPELYFYNGGGENCRFYSESGEYLGEFTEFRADADGGFVPYEGGVLLCSRILTTDLDDFVFIDFKSAVSIELNGGELLFEEVIYSDYFNGDYKTARFFGANYSDVYSDGFWEKSKAYNSQIGCHKGYRVEADNTADAVTLLKNSYDRAVTEKRLFDGIEKRSGAQITLFDAADYEGNGEIVMFAVADGNLWFANDSEAKLIEEYVNTDLYGGVSFFQTGKYRYAVNMPFTATAFLTCTVYGVKDGECFLSNLSGVGRWTRVNKYGDIVCEFSTHEGFDAFQVTDYCFFHNDGDRAFGEYGGTEITLSQFMQFDGADGAIEFIGGAMNGEFTDCWGNSEDYIKEGYEIFGIYYRGNGVVNINLRYYYITDEGQKTETYFNRFFSVRTTGKKIIEVYGYGIGYYKAALCPEIAVYPDITGMFG